MFKKHQEKIYSKKPNWMNHFFREATIIFLLTDEVFGFYKSAKILSRNKHEV
jgi:hypothetical protein